jgi:hypothetical protein
MNCPRVGFFGHLVVLLSLVAGCGIAVPTPAVAQPPAIPPLSANDVSWLFPPPTRVTDLEGLIAVRDLTTQNPQDSTKRDRVWTDAVFTQFVGIAASSAAQVAGTQSRIGLPADAQSIDAWFIAGIRIDAGAPGLSSDIQAQFGQSPEIRLIVQPVSRNADGSVRVNDIAGHLIFDFVLAPDAPAQAGCLPRPKPDLVEFKKIVAELASLRTRLSNGQLGTSKVTTGGDLGVHPGLADPTTANNVRMEMKAFLERHISGQRLNAMAIVGIPAGGDAPWIFVSMRNFHPGDFPALPNGGVVSVPGPVLDGKQVAQMLAPVGSTPGVVPEPHANNLNPATCRNAAVPTANPPIAMRKGSSTSALFVNPPPPEPTTQQILALIADPTKSHFFNTDCVSCHTETRRAMSLLRTTIFSGISPSVLPKGDWTVRNFGWSPPIEGPIQGVVTRRTAAETNAVVSFINSQILNK